VKLKALILSHAHLGAVLNELHREYGKQITDSNDSAMAASRAKVASDALAEAFGSNLTPATQYMNETIIGLIEALGYFGKALGTGIHGAAMMFVDSSMAVVHGSEAIAFALTGNIKGATAEASKAMGSLKSDVKDLSDLTIGWVPNMMKGLDTLIHAHGVGRQVVNEAIYKHNQADSHPFDPNWGPVIGKPKSGGGSSGGFNGGAPMQAQAEDTKALATAHTELANSSTVLAKALGAVHLAMNPLTDSESELVAKHKALNDAAAAAKQKIEELTPVVKADEVAVKSSRDAYNAKLKTLNDAIAAQDRLKASLDGHTKLSADEKRAVQEAADAVKVAEQAYKNADKALSAHNASLQNHLKILGQDTKAIQDNVDALNAQWKAYNDSREANAQKNTDELSRIRSRSFKLS